MSIACGSQSPSFPPPKRCCPSYSLTLRVKRSFLSGKPSLDCMTTCHPHLAGSPEPMSFMSTVAEIVRPDPRTWLGMTIIFWRSAALISTSPRTRAEGCGERMMQRFQPLSGPLSSPVGSLNATSCAEAAAAATAKTAAASSVMRNPVRFMGSSFRCESAFDASGREAGDQVLLEIEEERDHGDRDDDRAGGEVAPLLREAPYEEAQAHRGRVHVLLVHERGAQDELVPPGQEAEERGDGDGRFGERQDDPQE